MMARPKCTKEAIEAAVKLKQAGVNNKDIAAAIGVSESRFSKWVNHPQSDNQRQLGQALKKVEAEYKAALLSIIAKNAKNRDWKAAAWLLERKYPQEYGKQLRLPPQDAYETEDADAFFRGAGLDA